MGHKQESLFRKKSSTIRRAQYCQLITTLSVESISCCGSEAGCCSDVPGVDQKFGATIMSSHHCVTSGGVAAFHLPKSKSSSRERLRAGGDSGVPSEDDDDPKGAEGDHDHFHLRAGSSSSGDFRSKSSLRNDRYKCFGLLEWNILNSIQLQNSRRNDSANSSGQTSDSSTASSKIEDIADKIEEIGKLDTNIHSLMYKSVEVHKDVVVSRAVESESQSEPESESESESPTNRLIADTRKLCHLRRGGRLSTNRMPGVIVDKTTRQHNMLKIEGKKQENILHDLG
ncbi:conserved hypothetical protein [Culex quinquefasciatus]|uniref:Uncharacterized protein n=1 Tax=Culex quinquefasciatus TaxID=7176 RepID=B0X2H6_CULQU|nr:conserved hypothetical protein [Culex quinquefasciatus]|eukprot:XP_001863848.1 conserved hypothetical protein [Culex quinquefasciatus]